MVALGAVDPWRGGRGPLLPSPALGLSCWRPHGHQASSWTLRRPHQGLQSRQALLPSHWETQGKGNKRGVPGEPPLRTKLTREWGKVLSIHTGVSSCMTFGNLEP